MSNPTKLILERKEQDGSSGSLAGGLVMMTPAINENYWAYRVRLSEGQAIVGFPKFSTIGIGFAVETDWNTNLPYTCDAQEIYDHIKHNAGGPLEPATVIAAIELVQTAVMEDRPSNVEES